MNNVLSSQGAQSFEALKQTNEHGAEYWSARDLQGMLGYSQWRRFEDAIKRAMTSCETSGNNADYHFAGVGKMIEFGSGRQREVDARDKLAREGIRNKAQAVQTHEQVGKEVREAGGLLGGVPKKSGKDAL